jgi:hypothetical protein
MIALLFLLLLQSPATGADSAWRYKNLYDENTKSFYLPYQLWTGATWDGSKKIQFHKAHSLFMGRKVITGPEKWTHPHLKKEYQVYSRVNDGKVQLFTFLERGIGRVYDNRGQRYFENDIKFPAGPGWKVGTPVDFKEKVWSGSSVSERIVTIKVAEMKFDEDKTLIEMSYQYSVDHVPDHSYTYRPNEGMVSEFDLVKLKSGGRGFGKQH